MDCTKLSILVQVNLIYFLRVWYNCIFIFITLKILGIYSSTDTSISMIYVESYVNVQSNFAALLFWKPQKVQIWLSLSKECNEQVKPCRLIKPQYEDLLTSHLGHLVQSDRPSLQDTHIQSGDIRAETLTQLSPWWQRGAPVRLDAL